MADMMQSRVANAKQAVRSLLAWDDGRGEVGEESVDVFGPAGGDDEVSGGFEPDDDAVAALAWCYAFDSK